MSANPPAGAPPEATPPKAGGRGATGKPKGRPKLASPKPALPVVMTVRAKPEYVAWLDSLAERLGQELGIVNVDRMLAFDRAMADLAKALGHPAPPRRY